MNDYIIKPKSIKKNQLLLNNSISAFSFRTVFSPNKNTSKLGSLIKTNLKGFEPGSKSYIKFTDNYFVRIGELSDNEYTFNIKE